MDWEDDWRAEFSRATTAEAALVKARTERDAAQDEMREMTLALLAGEPFVFDPATNFVHSDDSGAPEHGIRYEQSTKLQVGSNDWHITDKRLEELANEADLNSRNGTSHIIFPGWWLEVHLALLDAQTCRSALSAMRKHAALLEKELDLATTAETALEKTRAALKWFVDRRFAIQAKFALHGPKDTADAMVGAFDAARLALSAGEEENGR